MENIKNQLNKEQKEAVVHQDGPLLIVAGAGTGKTALITNRIAHIIEQGWAKSEEILALTFTEKAAGEMTDRTDRLLPYGYYDLNISTFHSFCADVLKESGLDIGLPTDFKLLNEFEQYTLFKKNLERFGLDYYRPLGNPTKFIRDILKHISRCKDEDITPLEYLKYADELRQNLDGMLSGCVSPKLKAKADGKGGKKSGLTRPGASRHPSQEGISEFFSNAEGEFDETVAELEVKKIEEVANAYHVYQNLLLEKNALDFGDLINYCLKLFRERPNVLEKYRVKYKYILVDEFQDTNWAQYELVRLLVAPRNNITVVGDDDQCLPGESLVLTKNGNKRIDKIVAGEEVVTAVGKGYLSYSRVAFIDKNKKKAKLLTFKTASGRSITVTDNHKMFCYIPVNWKFYKKGAGEKRFFYVYLMHKQELGWRLGVTSDLAVRLKLERSADRIVAVKAFLTEEEARYHETLWSLKYGVPTVCFAERDGIMTKHKWSEKLYEELSVEAGVLSMANELNIDLNAHQFSLGGVVRGSKVRIKINLEMCARNYRSKYAKNNFLQSPCVLHLLSLETSYLPTIKILEQAGFNFEKSKKGKRLRIASADLSFLGKTALKIKKLSGGIIENSAKIGKTNLKTQKSLVIPAKNILPGMFIPIISGDDIVYEQIIGCQEKEKTLIVYDLEVEKTHNFIAEGVFVHNSIYRFRGAAMTNILSFKKDYPKAKQIFLTENYRSAQEILDLSYDFIKLNNPNRLEAQLAKEGSGLSKKLKANIAEKGIIEVIRGADTSDEIARVVKKIADIKAGDKKAKWEDFAILARANDHAKEVCSFLDEAGFPYKLNSSRGLYGRPEILNSIAYLTALADYYDGVALYKTLALPIFGFTVEDLAAFNYTAYKKGISLYKVLNEAAALGFDSSRLARINKFLAIFKKHIAEARNKSISEVFISFINESGYLKYLCAQGGKKEVESNNLLNQFMRRIKRFEADEEDKSVRAFLEELKVEIEAGEQGSLPFDESADPDTIKIMTVHAAKGLEFKYVFIINLIDKRFPSTERSEAIRIPDALLDEPLPEGDHHLEEERRLFYVAATRAKQELYFSWSSDAGGKRERRASRFLVEAGLVEDLTLENAGESKILPLSEGELEGVEKNNLLHHKKASAKAADNGEFVPVAPERFSYSQFEAYEKCPYQYRFANILRVPVRGKYQMSFGKTMHSTFQKILQIVSSVINKSQGALFDEAPKDKNNPITLEECLKIYKESWIDEWYESEADKKKYYKEGEESVKTFFAEYQGNWPKVLFLEKDFSLRMKVDGEGITIKGKIDRIDEMPDGKLRIVDYKTGKPKESLKFEEKAQLLIYERAIKELFRQEVGSLTYHYLKDNSRVEFLGKEKDFAKLDEKIENTIRAIRKGEFPPKPGMCEWCDFNGICEFRKL